MKKSEWKSTYNKYISLLYLLWIYLFQFVEYVSEDEEEYVTDDNREEKFICDQDGQNVTDDLKSTVYHSLCNSMTLFSLLRAFLGSRPDISVQLFKDLFSLTSTVCRMVMKINFIRLEILEDQKKSAQLQSVLS